MTLPTTASHSEQLAAQVTTFSPNNCSGSSPCACCALQTPRPRSSSGSPNIAKHAGSLRRHEPQRGPAQNECPLTRGVAIWYLVACAKRVSLRGTALGPALHHGVGPRAGSPSCPVACPIPQVDVREGVKDVALKQSSRCAGVRDGPANLEPGPFKRSRRPITGTPDRASLDLFQPHSQPRRVP